MALFQPSNITPSDLSGIGTIDATEDMAVTWQVNGTGNTPMTAYKVDLMKNDTASTLLYTTGQIALSEPFYGADNLGNPEYFTATIAKEALAAAGITNNADEGYKLLITQWWSAADSVAQTSASAFICRSRPQISIENYEQTITTMSYTFDGLYTQAQGDPIEWARWQISTGAGDVTLLDTGRIYNMGKMEISYDGFISGNNYSVRLSGQTINGVEFDTGWHVFSVQYQQTTFDGAAVACANCDTDAVQVNFPTPLYTMGRGGGDWSISEYSYATAGPASIVSFSSTLENVPIASLKAGIDPVQDLHGYDNPWPAGGGKNLIDLNGFESTTVSITPITKGVTVTVTNAGNNRNASQSLPLSLLGKTITLHADVTVSSTNYSSMRIYFIGNGSVIGEHILNVTGTGSRTGTATLPSTLPEGADSIVLRVYACTTGTTGVGISATYDNLQLEVGNEATSYAPYSNICPISGWTGAKVTRTGKNLLKLDESEMVSKGWNRIFPVSLKAGTYIISCQNQFGASVKGASVNLTDENDSTIIVALTSGYTFGDSIFIGLTVNITEDQADKIKNIRFALRAGGATYNDIAQGNIQLELGSTATAYAPYSGSTYDITFPTEAGTVYGGTLDAVSGELVLTHKYLSDNGSLGWIRNADGSFYVRNPSDQADQDSDGCLCNYAPFNISFSGMNVFFRTNGLISLGTGWGAVYSSADELKNAFASVPIQFVYKLATPITYQLTPQEIRTLLGTNNIWADTGDVTVNYPTRRSNNLVLPTASDSATWDSGDGSTLVINYPFSLAWHGYITNLSAEANPMSVLMGNGMLNMTVSSTGMTVTAGDRTLISLSRAFDISDEIIMGVTPGGYFVKINPGTQSAEEYAGTLTAWQDEINAITLYGPQTCEYVWVVRGEFTGAQMQDVTLDTPSFDTTTQFLASFDTGLSAGAIRTADPVTQVLVYRQTTGESTVHRAATLNIGVTAFRDYSAVNGKTYKYYLYGVTENGMGTTVIASNAIMTNYWNYDLLLCSVDSNGTYHVQREYRFALDVSSGTMSNNSKATMQANFTRYPLRQPNTQNYRSSTLTAYVGKSVNGNYVDSLSEIDALREISTSTLTKFLKTRKGELIRVETEDPVNMSIGDKYAAQPVRAAIKWVEVGSTENVSVITTTDDTYWTLS